MELYCPRLKKNVKHGEFCVNCIAYDDCSSANAAGSARMLGYSSFLVMIVLFGIVLGAIFL